MKKIMLSNKKQCSFAHAFLVFAVMFVTIALGIFKLNIPVPVVLFFCLIWVSINASFLGFKFTEIKQMMNDGIMGALSAIYIFLLIGMVIASFMHSGTVAALIYHGLDWISAEWFLPVGLILCAIMSVATGTSWGTVGTLGVVFIGLGSALGVPLPLVAGMVISGATFGDKLSPISDTTNLAAMSTNTNLYTHIQSMLYTTIPTFVLVLLIFTFWNHSESSQAVSYQQITEIQQALATKFSMNPLITLLPLLLMFILSMKRFAPEITMTASIVSAVLIAIFYQQDSVTEVLNALLENKNTDTGIEIVDQLLGKGGLYSMTSTLMLALMALTLGGVLHGAGFLTALMQGLIARIKRITTLIASTIMTGILGNISTGDSYVAIILNSQLYNDAYKEKNLKSSVLSRTVEESSTLITGLIPWTTTGVFYAGTLGVSVLEYAPYALLNYLNPLIAIIFAYFGIAIFKISKAKQP
ncbi:MAG: Na+/H+ antiporter NhaC [Proteobacteria bacterium]|nr:Na+/H+ antiporter NhaC [Pseudomonadota bacterium]